MVTTKKRTIRGRVYLYAAGSVTVQGRTKRFEKLIGAQALPEAELVRRRRFVSMLVETKCMVYRIYSEAKAMELKYLAPSCAFFLVLIPKAYHQLLASMYPSELDKYRQEFDVRYVHHTTAIEGNTLTLRDTALILDDGLAPKNKRLREIHEIENYKRTLAYSRSYDREINKTFLLTLHQLIQQSIDDNTAGSIRRINIAISGSTWTPPPAVVVPDELDELFGWYREGQGTYHAFELAGLFHHRLLQIHPFVDGNGRVAREVLNFMLQRTGLPPIIIPITYREPYMNALQSADDGDPRPLLNFLFSILFSDYFHAIVGYLGTIRQNITTGFQDLQPKEQAELQDLINWIARMVSEFLTEPLPLSVEPETLTDSDMELIQTLRATLFPESGN